MDLDVLRTFCAVLEEGSFHLGAERVHLTQSAVSQQISGLERQLNQVLIDRRSRTGTAAGLVLYNAAARILLDVEEIERTFADADPSRMSPLRVGTSDTTALYFLPPVVAAFTQQHPDIALTLVNRPSNAIATLVERAEVDLGIVTLPIGNERLEEKLLFEEQLVLVTPRQHPLTGRQRVTLRALKDEPLLSLDQTTHTGALLHEFFQRNEFTPRMVCTSGSFEVIKRYVAEGVGLAFLPAMTITDADRRLDTVKVSGLPRVRIGTITRRGAYRSHPQRDFEQMLRKAKR